MQGIKIWASMGYDDGEEGFFCERPLNIEHIYWLIRSFGSRYGLDMTWWISQENRGRWGC